MSQSTPQVNLIERLSAKLGASESAPQKPLVERAMERMNGAQEEPQQDSPRQKTTKTTTSLDGSLLHAAEDYDAIWEETESSGYIELNFSKMKKAGYITPDGKRSKTKEQYRVIKRPLLVNAFQRADQISNPHVIMVTSASPDEGKTFTATNLALSIAAEREIKVLLMDGDVIRQDLSRRFGIEAEKGYLDVLSHSNLNVTDYLVRTDVPSLAILPCGQTRENATELFASSRMGDLMQDLASLYSDRIIIIDTPPALASSETNALAMHAGQIVMVVESGKTDRQKIEEALSFLAPCENIFLVLNKAQESDLSDSYGSYSEYYGK